MVFVINSYFICLEYICFQINYCWKYITFPVIIQSNWFYIFRYSYLVALLVVGSSWASSSLILSSFLWIVSSFLCMVSLCFLLSPCSLWMVSSFPCATTLTPLSWDCNSHISACSCVLVLKLTCFTVGMQNVHINALIEWFKPYLKKRSSLSLLINAVVN